MNNPWRLNVIIMLSTIAVPHAGEQSTLYSLPTILTKTVFTTATCTRPTIDTNKSSLLRSMTFIARCTP